MNMIPSDTTIEAAVRQFEILRKLDINARAEMTFQLSNNLRRIVEAGVRQRHPDYDGETVKKAVLRLMIGERLFQEVFRNLQAKKLKESK